MIFNEFLMEDAKARCLFLLFRYIYVKMMIFILWSYLYSSARRRFPSFSFFFYFAIPLSVPFHEYIYIFFSRSACSISKMYFNLQRYDNGTGRRFKSIGRRGAPASTNTMRFTLKILRFSKTKKMTGWKQQLKASPTK